MRSSCTGFQDKHRWRSLLHVQRNQVAYFEGFTGTKGEAARRRKSETGTWMDPVFGSLTRPRCKGLPELQKLRMRPQRWLYKASPRHCTSCRQFLRWEVSSSIWTDSRVQIQRQIQSWTGRRYSKRGVSNCCAGKLEFPISKLSITRWLHMWISPGICKECTAILHNRWLYPPAVL